MASLRTPLFVAGGAALVAAVVAGIILTGEKLPDGPEPVAWDRAACAECRMHVGDPRFAVQLQTRGGDVLDFDDPGCFFLYEARERPEVHAVYFHDSREDRWLTPQQARFARMDGTPMGSGLAAVGTDVPGAVTMEQARSIALAPAPPERSP